MTYEEKLIKYATAPRARASVIQQIEEQDGKKVIVASWVGMLRGVIVTTDAGYKFDNKPDALENARKFRETARREASALGLIN